MKAAMKAPPNKDDTAANQVDKQKRSQMPMRRVAFGRAFGRFACGRVASDQMRHDSGTPRQFIMVVRRRPRCQSDCILKTSCFPFDPLTTLVSKSRKFDDSRVQKP